MKAAIALCLLLVCTIANAEPSSLQNSDVNTVKAELTKIHKGVKSRFKSKPPRSGEVFKYYTSFDTVVGDCDDFVSAAYYELWKIGADPVIYTYDFKSGMENYRHTIVCALDFCLDNNNRGVVSKQSFYNRLSSWAYELVEGGTGRLDEERMLALRKTELRIIGVKDERI